MMNADLQTLSYSQLYLKKLNRQLREKYKFFNGE